MIKKSNIIRVNPIDLALLLTIFLTVVHFNKSLHYAHTIYSNIDCILNWNHVQDIRYSATFWGIQVIPYFTWVYMNWQLIDNHRYLWGYWLLTIFIGLLHKKSKTSIQLSAKLLIIFCMAFAVIQKGLSDNFLSGDFLLYHLLMDARFAFIGTLLNFNLLEIIHENNTILSVITKNVAPDILNMGPPILKSVSRWLTWYIIVIELFIAFVFSLPRKVSLSTTLFITSILNHLFFAAN